MKEYNVEEHLDDFRADAPEHKEVKNLAELPAEDRERMLRAGIDGGEINRALFETKSRPRFEMERIVFDTMEFHEDGAIAVAVLWRKDIDRVGADMDDLDSIASLTRQIEGVQIGITMTEKADGTVRVSVRTTREMDASAICKRVGGGGHVRAAGASFTCGMDEAKAEMLRVAKEQFHAAD